MTTITKRMSQRARAIARKADSNGTINSDVARSLWPSEPTRHTCMDVQTAWRHEFGRSVDLDALSERAWGGW